MGFSSGSATTVSALIDQSINPRQSNSSSTVVDQSAALQIHPISNTSRTSDFRVDNRSGSASIELQNNVDWSSALIQSVLLVIHQSALTINPRRSNSPPFKAINHTHTTPLYYSLLLFLLFLYYYYYLYYSVVCPFSTLWENRIACCLLFVCLFVCFCVCV